MSRGLKKNRGAGFRPRRPTLERTPAPVPRIVPAQVLSSVGPTVPAYFLAAHLHQDQAEVAFWALFTIRADGTASVEMTASTGHAVLDAIALSAARRWRFQSATRDGEPVESYLRLKVEFDTALPAPGRAATSSSH